MSLYRYPLCAILWWFRQLAFKRNVEYRSERYASASRAKTESQSPLPKISTTNRKFKAFRIEIAEAILRNNAHLSALLSDIDAHPHIIELCDTYAMRLLLAWLGTKYGCPIFTSAIDSDKPLAVPAPERFFLSFDIYPFGQNFPVGNDAELFETARAFLDAAFEPTIELTGSLHEHMTSCEFQIEVTDARGKQSYRLHMRSGTDGKHGRRKKGQFYTPPWVVQYCLEKSLAQDSVLLMKAVQQRRDIRSIAGSHIFEILDPACGTGNFLLGVLRYLVERGGSADDVVAAAEECLFGRDLDGAAVSIAIWSIVLFVYEVTDKKEQIDIQRLLNKLTKHLRVTDSVFESFCVKSAGTSAAAATSSSSSSSSSSTSASESDPDAPHTFDLVITNPPYISFGSRGQEQILPSKASFLRRNFSISAEYKIRLNSIFQEVALNYVRDGGKICLFIPNSFLTGQGYAKLRAALLERTRILSLTELREDTMKDPVVGRWCVAVYQKGEPEKLDYPVELVTFAQADPFSQTGRNSQSHTLPQSEAKRVAHSYHIVASHLVTRDQSRFRLVFGKLDEELALRMEALAPLSSVARGHTGIRARAGQKTIIAETPLTQQHKRGIKSGGQVKPFSVEWDGTWMKIDPSLLYSGGFDNRIIENPKLLVRQTGDRIIAAYDESGLYHLNNIHSFSSQLANSNKKIDLHLLLGLMNSSFWQFVYRLKTREDGRALAQIDIETVESMPLPSAEEELLMRITNLSRELSSSALIPGETQNKNRSHLRDIEIRYEINSIVYRAYGLDNEEINHVERTLGVGYNSPLVKTGAS